MADVIVNSWTEFLQAIQVSGDTVICPDNAIWDMNDIEPDGHIGTIQFNCHTVYGHNTTIKNLKYDGQINFSSGFQLMSDLHWENILANTGNISAFFLRDGTISSASDLSLMTLCKISGYFTQTGAVNSKPISGFRCYRCGFNMESPISGTFTLPDVLQYSNFISQIPNAYDVRTASIGREYPFSHYFSNIVIVAPNAVADLTTVGANGCVFRGRKERLTKFDKYCGSDYMNLYCTTDMQAMENSRNVVGVTEEQLRDANYLASIGFPIGVD